MQSIPTKLSLRVKREENGFHGSTFPENIVMTSSEEEEDHSADDDDSQSGEDAQKQLVVYDPAANGTGEIEAVPDPNKYQPQPFPLKSFPFHSSKVLPSVGAFTVQCANCFKWRIIPSKEKYEEIREHILEQPFFCETAREWRSKISCEDPPDICQDNSRLWAIDKPSIAQPPPGWQRLLRIRGEGGTKFADVYYVAPLGKRLRSLVEVQRYLLEHPEYMEAGVTMSQFSFQIPRPLQENYVRKRPAAPRLTAPSDGTNLGMPGLLGPSDVNPLAWAGPDENTDLRFGGPRLSTPLIEAAPSKPINPPAKKRARSTSRRSNNAAYDQHKVKVEEPFQSRNGALDL
ncbi:Methyl-CpG-binding domain-containing protein [Actinidia chinensis var. chinensis]|uniref:Methyl-CpG-binding domain-containing protein n=1 Tax=Actinidia chinensis var. chinensis TaxID=1590841 RepID=A0A2R6S254_ACTCC|nr:Methyl-CpG-binding domain-containing protein [Actinidia chinensis var. chinensis]